LILASSGRFLSKMATRFPRMRCKDHRAGTNVIASNTTKICSPIKMRQFTLPICHPQTCEIGAFFSAARCGQRTQLEHNVVSDRVAAPTDNSQRVALQRLAAARCAGAKNKTKNLPSARGICRALSAGPMTEWVGNLSVQTTDASARFRWNRCPFPAKQPFSRNWPAQPQRLQSKVRQISQVNSL
jgi:hypothetical protein